MTLLRRCHLNQKPQLYYSLSDSRHVKVIVLLRRIDLLLTDLYPYIFICHIPWISRHFLLVINPS